MIASLPGLEPGSRGTSSAGRNVTENVCVTVICEVWSRAVNVSNEYCNQYKIYHHSTRENMSVDAKWKEQRSFVIGVVEYQLFDCHYSADIRD